MQKQKILIFIDWFLPGYKAGGPVRSMANMVDYLKDEYDFYIYTSNQDHDGTLLDVEYNKWVRFDDAAQVFYSAKPSFGEVKSIIKEVEPNVVYLNSVFSLKYTVFPLMVNKFGGLIPKVVFAPRGMFQKGALQLKARKKRTFLNIVKPLFFKAKNIVWHATDEQEVEDIKNEICTGHKSAKANICEVSNIPTTKTKSYNIIIPDNEIRFVTISLVAEKKNHRYFLELLREVNVPNGKKIVYDIYGPIKDEAYWQQCQELIKQLPAGIDVNYKGSVIPTKVSETLQAYHYFVLPTLGENFGHAIFEALINGVPCLLSDQTPWSKLEESKSGWSIPLSQTDEWLRNLNTLLAQISSYNETSMGAQQVAKKYINDQDFISLYHRLLT